jgi:hypothetical protein
VEKPSPESIAAARAAQRRERTLAIVQMLVDCSPDELDVVIAVIDRMIDHNAPWGAWEPPTTDPATIAELRLLLGERLPNN